MGQNQSSPIDWICVSPKNNTTTNLKTGDELKFVYPQKDFEPIQFESYNFNHFFIQPMDNNDYEKNKKLSETFVEKNPKWKLSLQTKTSNVFLNNLTS